MRWLITRPLIVLLLSILATSVALLLGRTQPMPDRVALLRLDDCHLPCWIGIVPGKTTVGQARQRIRDVYGKMMGFAVDESEIKSCCIKVVENGQSRLLITLNTWGNQPDSTGVQLIYLDVVKQDHESEANLSIADTIGFLGNPSYFVFSAASGGQFPPTLIYAAAHCELIPYPDASSYQGEVSPSMQINSLTIYDQLPVGQDSLFSPQLWRGFGRFYHAEKHNQ
jgi:hypothetical protein